MSIKRIKGQVDYFGIVAETDTPFECTDSTASVSTNDVTPNAPDGTFTDFISEVSGATLQSDYTVKCPAGTVGGVAIPALLGILDVDTADLPACLPAPWEFFVTGCTVNTAAGTLPTLSLSATGIKGTCAAPAYVAKTGVVLSPFAKAQLLFGIGSATGGTVTGANYVFSGSTQTKTGGDSAPVVLDISGGIITASLTLNQSVDGTPPTFALGEGWKIQQPLVNAGTSAGLTTWTMTAVLPLAKVVV